MTQAQVAKILGAVVPKAQAAAAGAVKNMMNQGAGPRRRRRGPPDNAPAPIPRRNWATGAPGTFSGKEYYDAFATKPQTAMTSMSIGAATAVTAISIKPMETSTTFPVLMIIYPHSSTRLATICTFGSGDAGASNPNGDMDSTDTPVSYDHIESPTWAGSHPHEVIPTRCSVRIANSTQRFQQGGIVRSLRASTGNTMPTYNAALKEMMEQIKVNDRCRPYDGAELKDQKQINAVVIDSTRANKFRFFGNYNMMDPEHATVTTASGDKVIKAETNSSNVEIFEPAMSPIYLLFEKFDQKQLYEINIRAHYLCHYPSGSLLNNLALNPPSNPAKLNVERNKSEAKGSALQDVVEDALAYASKNGHMIGNMLDVAGHLAPYAKSFLT